jgi:hypothetical protein
MVSKNREHQKMAGYTQMIHVILILLAVLILGSFLGITREAFQCQAPREGFQNETQDKDKDEQAVADATKKAEEAATAVKTTASTGDSKAVGVVQDQLQQALQDITGAGGNKNLMSKLSTDTTQLMESQKNLMKMMEQAKPIMSQGMQMMKSFKTMFGNADL